MKCEVVIDPATEERVVIYVKEHSALIEEVKRLVEEPSAVLLGYIDDEIVKLNPYAVQYIVVTDGKVFAVCDKTRYLLKERLYVLEERLPETFVRIHQSCLANVAYMQRFDTSISGTLKIRFKNGDIEYVSRRQLKAIKERIGI